MSRKQNYDIDVESVSHDDLKKAYKSLLASRTSLKQHNGSLTKWASAIGKSCTKLSCEGSLAFQAMAEKAGVRSHPSVTSAVELFDKIGHPQWHGDAHTFPIVEWPNDWDIDPPNTWSGDADMLLNSPISDAIEFIEHARFSMNKEILKHSARISDALHKALVIRVDAIKEDAGFIPKSVNAAPNTHYRDMNNDQLMELVESLTFMALDLAQDMHFANNMLRRDLRAATFRRVCCDLYKMSQLGFEWGPAQSFSIKVMGSEEAVF